MKNLPKPPLLLITDRRLARPDLSQVVVEAFAGGCRWLMVREKDLPNEDLRSLVNEIMGIARHYDDAMVLINSNATVASLCGAHGVHLPQGHSVHEARRVLGADALVGVSTHSLTEALQACRDGADYITFSPVFESISKPGYGPSTAALEGLKQVASGLSIPVIALGGITPENVIECFEAGAAGVAVLGGIMSSLDPRAAVHAYVRRMGDFTFPSVHPHAGMASD